MTVVTAAIRQWCRRSSAYVQAGSGHFAHHFLSRVVHMQTC